MASYLGILGDVTDFPAGGIPLVNSSSSSSSSSSLLSIEETTKDPNQVYTYHIYYPTLPANIPELEVDAWKL